MKRRYILVSLDGPFDNVMKFKPPISFDLFNCEELINSLDQVLFLINKDDNNNVTDIKSDMLQKLTGDSVLTESH
jgi:hypothetical protein